jgi:hypothetical protein
MSCYPKQTKENKYQLFCTVLKDGKIGAIPTL